MFILTHHVIIAVSVVSTDSPIEQFSVCAGQPIVSCVFPYVLVDFPRIDVPEIMGKKTVQNGKNWLKKKP